MLDAPKGEWGSILSQRKEEKVDPSKDLGEFAAKSDAQKKERDGEERKRWGKQREQGIAFTEPVKTEAGMPPISKGKFARGEETVRQQGGVDCDWRITPAEGGWTVADGKVYYLNDSTEATVLSTTVLGEGVGSIYLHVTRDPASRAVTAQVVEFSAGVPFTGESDQYFELGRVGGTPSIIQTQFTPIRVYEDLFVINGEFRLGNIAMLADNLYALPAP